MYASGTIVKIETVSVSNHRGQAEIELLRPMMLTAIIETISDMGRSLLWKRFRISVGNECGQWHYIN